MAQWLDDEHADEELRATATGLRGFFLADPDELSLIALVDQFSNDDQSWPRTIASPAATIGCRRPWPRSSANACSSDPSSSPCRSAGSTCHASIKHQRATATMTADYLVFAMPASLLRRVPIVPALPTPQHQAIASLDYGRATKTLLQFDRRFWRAPGKPRAFGSALPFGAVWEGNEEQAASPGILSLLAGGSASDATQAEVAADGIARFAAGFSWLGNGQPAQLLIASRQIVWESDPWARGGYAFFDPAFDPALRHGWRGRSAACFSPASTRASAGRAT